VNDVAQALVERDPKALAFASLLRRLRRKPLSAAAK